LQKDRGPLSKAAAPLSIFSFCISVSGSRCSAGAGCTGHPLGQRAISEYPRGAPQRGRSGSCRKLSPCFVLINISRWREPPFRLPSSPHIFPPLSLVFLTPFYLSQPPSPFLSLTGHPPCSALPLFHPDLRPHRGPSYAHSLILLERSRGSLIGRRTWRRKAHEGAFTSTSAALQCWPCCAHFLLVCPTIGLITLNSSQALSFTIAAAFLGLVAWLLPWPLDNETDSSKSKTASARMVCRP
jgi:hypothetical protein